MLIHKIKWAISSEISHEHFKRSGIILDKYVLKIIYKLRSKGSTIRNTKKILREKYNLNIKEKDINIIAMKINTRNGKYTEIDKKRILYLYKNYFDTNKLVRYLNEKYGYELTYRKLIDYASSNGVKKSYKNMYSISWITRDDEYRMIDLYKRGKSSNEISKVFGYRSRNSTLQKLHRHNVNLRDSNETKIKRKSYYNFSFELIDSNEKAYFIGLLLTDGYVVSNRSYVGIDLSDKDVIEMLCTYINTTYRVIEPNKNGKAKQNKYRIILHGKKILQQLERFSIVERKTYSLQKPLLFKSEMKYLNYILRGIIDGDGWIRKDGKEFFICSASLDFINWCRDSLIYIGLENIEVKYIKNQYSGIYMIRSASIYNIEIIRSKVYSKPFGMMRKYSRIHGKDVQRL